MTSNEKSQFQGLFLIETRVAEGRIIQTEILIRQAFAPANTFRHGVAR